MKTPILALAVLLLPVSAGAVTKCVDPAGRVTYTDAPCPPGSSAAPVALPPAPSADEAMAAQARAARIIRYVAQREAAESAASATRSASLAQARARQDAECRVARDDAAFYRSFALMRSRPGDTGAADAIASAALVRAAQAGRGADSNACRFRLY